MTALVAAAATPSANRSRSTLLPLLQLGLDSTSLSAFKKCPRYYQRVVLEGWQPKRPPGWPNEWTTAVDLQFGIFAHLGREAYEDAGGNERHDSAVEAAFQAMMSATWRNGRPWDSGDSIKNRWTLVRSMIWYFEQWRNDPMRTLQRADGKPLVEHSFCFDSGYRSRLTGEAFLLCGHLDRVGDFQDSPWIDDLKTTRSSLDRWWVETFTPDNQFSIYLLAGQVALPVRC